MKKIIGFVCIVAILMSTTVFAKTGDIAGEYYSTDIKTYLNGAEIDAINIGGQTLISAEDMCYYGFSVWWNAEDRTLRIQEITFSGDETKPLVSKQEYPTGTPIGHYYETDIVTYLDNAPATAYNIGGRTYIHAEEMHDFGYVVQWYSDERKLEITSPMRAGYVYDIELSRGKEQTEDGEGSFSVKYTKDGIIGSGDADYLNLTMYSTGRGYEFQAKFYQNEGLLYSLLLQDKLKPLCYDGFGVEIPCDKTEKYELVNRTVSISVNGRKAERVSVVSGAGNGHRDFYFTAEDLPKFKKDDINEIIFTVD